MVIFSFSFCTVNGSTTGLFQFPACDILLHSQSGVNEIVQASKRQQVPRSTVGQSVDSKQLDINTLTLGRSCSISSQAPPPTHAPVSTYLRLLAPMASDLPIGDVLKTTSYLDLFTIIFYSWRTKKKTISELWPH